MRPTSNFGCKVAARNWGLVNPSWTTMGTFVHKSSDHVMNTNSNTTGYPAELGT